MRIPLGGRFLGPDEPVFIIAELSANHNQNYDLAVRTIKAMKEAGADAVKLQTYTADTITFNSDNDCFKIKHGTLWDGKTLYDLYKEAFTPWEWQPELKRIAESLGMICFSSPFDPTAVDFLEKMNVPAYKVASFEITDIPLIEYIASKGKPVIIATGIAERSDIDDALSACHRMGNDQVVLLKCTSAYPAPLDEINLKMIPDMAERFHVITGLSDHTLGTSVAVAAVALGAKVIEKHFILDRKLGGPDSEFSCEPAEFKTMVQSIRDVERSLGTVSYELSGKSKTSRAFSRSLFVVKDIKAGETFTPENVKSLRPGCGLAPKYLKDVLARKAKAAITKGTPLLKEMIE